MVAIADVKLTDGPCAATVKNLQCGSNEFQCDDKCLPTSKQCDGRVDCYGNADEEGPQCGMYYYF